KGEDRIKSPCGKRNPGPPFAGEIGSRSWSWSALSRDGTKLSFDERFVFERNPISGKRVFSIGGKSDLCIVVYKMVEEGVIDGFGGIKLDGISGIDNVEPGGGFRF